MPKVAEPKSYWQKLLSDFANSQEPSLGHGMAPRKDQPEHKTYLAIKTCPKHMKQGTLSFGTTKQVSHCICGYYMKVVPEVPPNEPPKHPAAASNLPAVIRMKNPYAKNTTTHSNQTVSKKSTPIKAGATLTLVPKPPHLPTIPSLPMISASLPKQPVGLTSVAYVRNVIKCVAEKGFLDLYIFGPTDGKCIYCNQANLIGHNPTRLRMAYRAGWPCYVQGVHLRCRSCQRMFRSIDSEYVLTLPYGRWMLPFFFHGQANGVNMGLIRMQCTGQQALAIEHFCQAELSAV